MNALRKRSGFALALAVCLLAAIGSLAGATFFAIREARRAVTRVAKQEEAATEADARLFALVGGWDALERDSLRVGATDSSLSGPNPWRVDWYVTRVTTDVYSATAVGRSGRGTIAEARRAHNLLIRVLRPALGPRGALVSLGDVVVSREASLSGHDLPPPGWEECPPADSGVAPTVLVPDGRTARDLEGQHLREARFDSLAGAQSTYRVLGRVSAAFLAERADVRLGAGAMVSPHPAVGDNCAPGNDITSWGEPWRTVKSPRCQRYFPVIHANGDIVVTAGRGQGVLLVDGRLRIEGPFVFSGVVVAGGGIETSGASVSVYGAVLSGGASGVRWASPGDIQRSTCAVARALAAASRPVPVSRRGWSELF